MKERKGKQVVSRRFWKEEKMEALMKPVCDQRACLVLWNVVEMPIGQKSSPQTHNSGLA